MNKNTIAIDGPAASGKTTVGRMLAAELNYLLLDTGIMYRAVALAASQQQIALDDEAAVTALAHAIQLEITAPTEEDGRLYSVFLDGNDVTWDLRTDVVNRSVSLVASYREVRAEMVARQRIIGAAGGVVMVGRDIGTVVMPSAPLKIYLTASAEERAQRRYDEKVKRGDTADYETMLADIIRRDQFDSTREHSPLLPAADAVQIDSTAQTPTEIVAAIRALLA